MPKDADQVEAWRGEAECPFCGHTCIIVDDATEMFWRDACRHFDGQTHIGFMFVAWEGQMIEKGKLRIPDMMAMDRVTDLQQAAGWMEASVDKAYQSLDKDGWVARSEELRGAWYTVHRILDDLGLLGDTAGLWRPDPDKEELR